jgi:hypothetical protein
VAAQVRPDACVLCPAPLRCLSMYLWLPCGSLLTIFDIGINTLEFSRKGVKPQRRKRKKTLGRENGGKEDGGW